MDDSELSRFIERKVTSALNRDGGELSSKRESVLNYYNGALYGNEREGHSQVVTREVFETVEWALPSVLRVFTADRPVEFLPEGVEDEHAAQQETDVVNHLLFNQENGFLAIHNWAKDAIMYPTGYAKIWADEVERTTVERYRGLTVEQVAALVESGAEITAASGHTTPMGEVYDVEARISTTKPVLRFEAVAPEEVLVDDGLASIELDDARFVCHRTQKTFSELVEMGFDRKRLEQVGADDTDTVERQTRIRGEEFTDTDDDEPALREYWVEECYCLVDYDGDGIAERRRVVRIGNEIFENEEDDYIPLVAMSAIIMPHRHAGVGLAESVQDIQLVSSTLMRQLLTNLYRINQPRKYVGETALVNGGMTMDALLDAAAEVIPVRDPSAIVPEVIQSLGQHILPVMAEVGQMRQLRTGVNPQISLDPEVLRQSTQGAFTQAIDHSSQRLEMVIRGMAETGIKSAMRKAHRIVRERFGSEIALKLRGTWVNVNPQEWRERTNMKVTVGVGTQNRQDRLSGLGQVAALQEKLMPLGMVTPQHLFATVSEIIDATGQQGAERFFIDPSKQQLQQSPPDPLMMAQAENLKASAQAMQVDAQSKMARAQIEAQKAQLEQAKAQFEAQVKAQTAALEARRAELDAQMAMGKAQADVGNTVADTRLKEAQRIKVLEEARALDMETDATETGVIDMLKVVGNG